MRIEAEGTGDASGGEIYFQMNATCLAHSNWGILPIKHRLYLTKFKYETDDLTDGTDTAVRIETHYFLTPDIVELYLPLQYIEAKSKLGTTFEGESYTKSYLGRVKQDTSSYSYLYVRFPTNTNASEHRMVMEILCKRAELI